MRPLNLDYVVSRTPSIQGVLLLLLALISVAAVWQFNHQLQQQLGSVDQQLRDRRELSGIKTAVAPVQKKSSTELLNQIEQARKMADFLLVPWRQVFTALEIAALDDAAVLAIEPDAKKRQLKLTIEAKNQDVMFAYIARLEATPQLTNVYLLKHEIMEDADQHPIRFVATAKWAEQRGSTPLDKQANKQSSKQASSQSSRPKEQP